MSEKMKIALIGGTGNLGPGLALRWAHAGYPVIIGSRSADKAQATVDEIKEQLQEADVRGMENAAAVAEADVAILTVQQAAHQAALESVKDELQGKILVDATARMSFPDLTPPAPPAAARIAQDLLGEEVGVVGAFQNVPAAALSKNLGEQLESHVLVCGDDVDAAETVIGLAEAIGLRSFYAGDLDKAIVVEGLTSLLVAMNKHYKSHHGTIQIAGY